MTYAATKRPWLWKSILHWNSEFTLLQLYNICHWNSEFIFYLSPPVCLTNSLYRFSVSASCVCLSLYLLHKYLFLQVCPTCCECFSFFVLISFSRVVERLSLTSTSIFRKNLWQQFFKDFRLLLIILLQKLFSTPHRVHLGQWLWHIWQSGCFQNTTEPRAEGWIQSLAIIT